MRNPPKFSTSNLCERLSEAAVFAVQTGYTRHSLVTECGQNRAEDELDQKAEKFLNYQLNRERRKAKAGSPGYDFNRHLLLLCQLKEFAAAKSKTPT